MKNIILALSILLGGTVGVAKAPPGNQLLSQLPIGTVFSFSQDLSLVANQNGVEIFSETGRVGKYCSIVVEEVDFPRVVRRGNLIVKEAPSTAYGLNIAFQDQIELSCGVDFTVDDFIQRVQQPNFTVTITLPAP